MDYEALYTAIIGAGPAVLIGFVLEARLLFREETSPANFFLYWTGVAPTLVAIVLSTLELGGFLGGEAGSPVNGLAAAINALLFLCGVLSLGGVLFAMGPKTDGTLDEPKPSGTPQKPKKRPRKR